MVNALAREKTLEDLHLARNLFFGIEGAALGFNQHNGQVRRGESALTREVSETTKKSEKKNGASHAQQVGSAIFHIIGAIYIT